MCFIRKLSYEAAIVESNVSDADSDTDTGESNVFKTSKETIADYYNYIRELCSMSLAATSSKIGGPGLTVEIDASKFDNSKYNKG